MKVSKDAVLKAAAVAVLGTRPIRQLVKLMSSCKQGKRAQVTMTPPLLGSRLFHIEYAHR